MRFKISEGQRLENIAKTKPRKFWNALKKCYNKPNKGNYDINTEDLFNHFNDLLGQNVDNNDDTEFYNIQDDDFDCQLKEEEVHCAVFKQKIGKASGPDELPAEIIKASYDYL